MSESQPPEPPSRRPEDEGAPEAPDHPEGPEAQQPEPPEPHPEATEAPQSPEPEATTPPEGTPPGAVPFTYEPPPPHPVRLVVYDDLKRSRLTVFFRLLLLIPHVFWQYVWGFVIIVCAFVNWFAVLIRGRTPEDLHLLLARALRYRTHVVSYMFLVSNPYPTFFGRPGSHPVDLEVEGPERQRRAITFFRLILAIPAFVVAYVFVFVLFFVAFIGWFVALVVGRMPKGMRDLSAYCLQYEAQTYGYILILTDRYPSFSGPRS
jgi:Domain of unknown function (DUF4389)